MAYLFGHLRIHHRGSLMAWLVPVPLWAATVLFSALFSFSRGAKAETFMVWTKWGFYAIPGLFMVSMAIRAWWGFRHHPASVPADPRPLGRRLLLRLSSDPNPESTTDRGPQ
ncbi:hypothetical protein [Streptomyces nojiriensis]|uniref:hypothetical protein n=1 Tax=Streptomyces nojiriensis TaxID=66374 RepID=UPI00364E91E2